jgi:uncharacterized membrane protein HdeD (DUF308 family)
LLLVIHTVLSHNDVKARKSTMLTKLARNWWALALRGTAAIIFGILALVWPSLTIAVLVILFGAFAFVDGIFAVIAGIASHENNQRWWAMLLAGVGEIIIGLLTFFWPRATAFALLYLVAAWALVTGIFHIIAAIHLRREIKGEWLVILSGFHLAGYSLYSLADCDFSRQTRVSLQLDNRNHQSQQ